MVTNGPHRLTVIHLDTKLMISPANLQNFLLVISLLSILSQVCCLFLGLHFRNY